MPQAQRSTNAVDTEIWSFMKVLFNSSRRHGLLQHLGHNAEAIKHEVDGYASRSPFGAAPASPKLVQRPASTITEAVMFKDAASLFGAPQDAASLFGASNG